jgi:hypothetical protein
MKSEILRLLLKQEIIGRSYLRHETSQSRKNKSYAVGRIKYKSAIQGIDASISSVWIQPRSRYWSQTQVFTYTTHKQLF